MSKQSKAKHAAAAAPHSARPSTRSQGPVVDDDLDDVSPKHSRKSSSRRHQQCSPSNSSNSKSSPERPPPVPSRKSSARQPAKCGRPSTTTVDERSNHSDNTLSDDGRVQPSKSSRRPSPKRKRQRQRSPTPILDIDEVDDEVDEATGLKLRHGRSIPNEVPVKAEAIYTIFSPFVKATISGFSDPMRGRWCTICQQNKHSDKVFYRGANSTLRAHLRNHWEKSKKRCEAKGLAPHDRCMPPKVAAEKQRTLKEEAARVRGDNMNAGKLEAHFEKRVGPREFSKDTVLEYVAKYITCCDKPLATANNVFFRNALVAMRPSTKSLELSSTHKVCVYIHNEFVAYLERTTRAIDMAMGKVSMTGDTWSSDNNKMPYMGSTAAWVAISPETRVWSLEHKVVGFRDIFGPHDGSNLGGYFISVCRRVGIINIVKRRLKLGPVTFDNTANNGTTCVEIESIHIRLELSLWLANDNQCFAHVINLGVVDVMACITKIAAIETTTAIWDYDPELPNNRIMNGSLDAVAALRTLAVKIQASRQCVQYFNKIQKECGLDKCYKITMHGNTRWETAHGMMARGIKLIKAINLFVRAADHLYGPITVIRKKGKIVKKIKWSAFEFGTDDWALLKDGHAILDDSNKIQQAFSSARRPTLWKIIPLIETLLTAWEGKQDDAHFFAYRDAITAGIDKINKYYKKINTKEWYILAMFIHPYYKLDWFKTHWGGAAAPYALLITS